MNKRAKRVLSVLLAICLLCGAGAIGVNAANATVAIAQTDSVSTIQTNIQNAINGIAAGETVTVTGSKTGAATALTLNIPTGKKVIWQAGYASASIDYLYLICLTGTGTFEVATGSTISTTGDGCYAICNDAAAGKVTIVVSGGTVSINGDDGYDGGAITANAGNVTVSGGTVQASGDWYSAIATTSGDVTATGGTIKSSGGYSDTISTRDGNIRVSGGTVQASGSRGTAICCGGNGNIMMTGGTVQATRIGLFVWDGNVTVTGGTVSASGDSFPYAIVANNNGIGAFLAGTCTNGAFFSHRFPIVQAESLSIPKSYNTSSAGLTLKAGTGTAVWDCTGIRPAIKFSNGKAIEWGSYAAVKPTKGILGTNPRWNQGWHYILFFLCFGFIWMWF